MIEDVRTGERLATLVRPVVPRDLRSLGSNWRFRWLDQLRQTEVFKLLVPATPDQILGLIAVRRIDNQYVEVVLLEVNPADVGRSKRVRGIAGSLFAFAVKLSIQIGGEGFLALDAKTELIDHYINTYQFRRVGKSQRLLLEKAPAARLLQQFDRESLDA